MTCGSIRKGNAATRSLLTALQTDHVGQKRIADEYKEKLITKAAEIRKTATRKVSNESMITMTTEPTTSLDNKTPLHYAAKSGNQSVVEVLLIKEPVLIVLTKIKTPLHYAAKSGNSLSVKKILDEGASVDFVDKDSKTPLHYAADHVYGYGVQPLLDKGASVDCVDKEQLLHYAAEGGLSDLSKMIIDEVHIDVNSLNKRGRTALHYAAERRRIDVDIIRTLLDKGCDPNIKDEAAEMREKAQLATSESRTSVELKISDMLFIVA
ncbi:ankyrin-3-like [Gigantopelta aegis]|uniref:ankyrin-3-like n=1 Tax=Gigantopelta aegis TaxID=1735272 RepID=UPI001B88BAA3|nr:ankyrin-3-like [Gigantopelta aegis]